MASSESDVRKERKWVFSSKRTITGINQICARRTAKTDVCCDRLEIMVTVYYYNDGLDFPNKAEIMK